MSGLVIAVGGNAISPEGERDTIENQFRRTRFVTDAIAEIAEKSDVPIVITHGNGPQVGNVLRRVEHARGIAPDLPLDICVADTQGGMGYMIAQCLVNSLAARGVQRAAASLVTQVVVAEDDPAFGEPTKPIGQDHRLVASPAPLRVVELNLIKTLAGSGAIVIAGGGGGVPVVQGKDGLRGIGAVIDKDVTACLIAIGIDANLLVILTSAGGVFEDFGSEDERLLRTVSPDQLESISFPEGSMGPKIRAVCRFVRSGKGRRAVVASLDQLPEAAAGRAGTQVTA